MANLPTAPLTQGPAFDCDPSVLEYQVGENEYLLRNPQYRVVVAGIAVFNEENKLLLVQRAKSEKAFPECWEIPGGKIDEPDKTILHGAVRELKEETGLEATRIVRKVGMFEFGHGKWVKHIFEMDVKTLDTLALDPVEHDNHLWASEEEIMADRVGDVPLKYISPDNKMIKLEAFRHRREAASM